MTTHVAGVVNGLSFTRKRYAGKDPASFVLSGSDDSGSTYQLIAEGTVPAFSARGQRKQVFIENNTSYSTYKLIFPSVVDFNSSDEMQIAEIELLGVPESDEWLSVNRIFQLGSKNRKRILAGSSGSWRFNDGLQFQEPTVGQTNLQTWVMQLALITILQFFLNGQEQAKSDLDNEIGFPVTREYRCSLVPTTTQAEESSLLW